MKEKVRITNRNINILWCVYLRRLFYLWQNIKDFNDEQAKVTKKEFQKAKREYEIEVSKMTKKGTKMYQKI